MADTHLHSLRFQRDGAEFEITSSAENVARVWDALAESVATAFAQPPRGAGRRRAAEPDPADLRPEAEQGDGATDSRRRRPASRRRTTTTGGAEGGGGGGRADVVTRLLGPTDLDTFPELGDDPKAEYAGYAVLAWARDQLEIDGLTVSEIQRFLANKLRISKTPAAYRNAFNGNPRCTDSAGSPTVYRLMRPGKAALDTYLESIRQGKSVAEAAAAGDEAEEAAAS